LIIEHIESPIKDRQDDTLNKPMIIKGLGTEEELKVGQGLCSDSVYNEHTVTYFSPIP
jgi:hypothetical protein